MNKSYIKLIVNIILIIVIIILIYLFIKYQKKNKTKILREKSIENFNNFDIQNYKKGQEANANLANFIPKKTSKLVTLENESFGEAIEW